MANSITNEPFLNILIEGNVVYNDHTHGITVGFTDGLVIRNNTLLHDPHTAGLLGWPPRILLTEGSLNLTIEGNITGDVWNWDDMTNDPGWTVGNNLLLEYDSASPDYYAPLFVNPLAVGATLADLRAVAGGVIELGGIGAAMTRADIPMVVGPFATAPIPPPADTCEADLVAAQAALVVAEAERDAAVAALVSMTLERDAAVALQSIAETELATMTVERDTALAERDAALLAQSATLTDLAIAQAQLVVKVDKLAEIHVISGG